MKLETVFVKCRKCKKLQEWGTPGSGCNFCKSKDLRWIANGIGMEESLGVISYIDTRNNDADMSASIYSTRKCKEKYEKHILMATDMEGREVELTYYTLEGEDIDSRHPSKVEIQY